MKNTWIAHIVHIARSWLPALIAALMAIGCSSISFDSALFSDDAWIAKSGDSYSYIRGVHHADTETASVDFKGFYGKHTVWAFESEGEAALTLDLDLSADLRGRYKVCFVTADKQVLTLEAKPGQSSHLLALSAGVQYIVLVGDAAYGSVALRLYHAPEPRAYEPRVLL